MQAVGLSGHLPLFWSDVENSSWVGGTADTGLHERTLAQCRQQERAIMLFKIIHKLVDIPVNSYLTPIPMTRY